MICSNILSVIVLTTLFWIGSCEILFAPENNITFVSISLEKSYKWKSIFLKDEQQPAYYDPEVDAQIQITCNAPIPVKWTVSGNGVSALWKIETTCNAGIDFTSTLHYMGTLGPTSICVKCYVEDKPEVYDEILIFAQRDNKGPLVENLESKVKNSKLIPCPAVDPTADIKLYRNASNLESLVSDFDKSLRYHPVEGFWSDNVFDGVYFCKGESSFVTITALSTLKNDFQFIPDKDVVKSFDDHVLSMQCISNSKQLHFYIQNTSVFEYMSSNSTSIPIKESHQIIKLSTNVSQVSTRHTLYAQVSSYLKPQMRMVTVSATCMTINSNEYRAVILKSWRIEFLKAPKLQIDNYQRRFQCSSEDLAVQMRILPCNLNTECNFIKSHCQKRIFSCNVESQDTFVHETCSRLYKPETCQHAPSWFKIHNNGIVECSVDGLSRDWVFFESLDHKKYTSWMQAKERELIRMDEVPSILYTTEIANFTCEALQYLFDRRVRFKIVFQNSTSEWLQDNKNTVNISFVHPYTSDRLKLNLNYIWIMNIYLPLDAMKILCVATFRNSSKTMETTRTFHMDSFRKPNPSTKNVTFHSKKDGQRLICTSTENSTAETTWYFNDTEICKVFPELRINATSGGESFLEFGRIRDEEKDKYSGRYKCLTPSLFGIREYTFYLEISPESSEPKNFAVYISIMVTGISLVCGALSLVGIIIKKHKKYRITAMEEIPLQDNRYKIALDDFHYEFSFANLLGSGTFALVVKGLIKSKGQPAALKIPKPSSDMTTYESMISEIAIMEYIGQHDNVISFFGAYKGESASKQIIVAMEICHLGSLDLFLRKRKSNFLDLTNCTLDELDAISIDSENAEEISTIDLIKFSAQIAAGMEYLAYTKSVVHADLSARNVLLTSAKVAKISDFGLSKIMHQEIRGIRKPQSRIPWRWMPIESLETNSFTSMSDVWAYGVTLFEIFTLGDIPYSFLQKYDHTFLPSLRSGTRLEKPEYSTTEIYAQMYVCWAQDPHFRPNFGNLRVFFENLSSMRPFVARIHGNH